MRRLLLAVLYVAIALAGSLCSAQAKDKLNVLFIAVDDLRPELNCFGATHVKSPNIDRLAQEGVIFSRAYCQVPVCGASRASLLSGCRADTTKCLRYNDRLRDHLPDVVTLPQNFKDHGYTTVSLGKIYHVQNDDPQGWSEPVWRPKMSEGNWRDYALPESRQWASKSKRGNGPPFECADVDDDAYGDGKTAQEAIKRLRLLRDKPFFLAVGFLKPHLPFNAPKKYWDLYPTESVELPDNPFPPKDAPRQAMHNWGELRAYTGIPKKGPLPDDFARQMIRGYYAATSYTDAQIGRVLDELDRLGLSERTVVVLWGDHGWNLREHGLWCKHCNFHTSLNAPLMFRVPGIEGGKKCDGLVEFVDIYPTLAELCDLPLPDTLEGGSLVPLLKDPTRAGKKAVFSIWFAGRSVRTDRYLFTEWRDKQGKLAARMLYDHHTDPAENVNVAEQPANKVAVEELSKLLRAGWRGVPQNLQ